MACIKIIDSIKIYIYSRYHNPPHFHAIMAEFEELFVIETMETYSGKLPSAYRKKIMEWAIPNQKLIQANWDLLNKKK
jgi:hypothetical protein